MNAKRSYRILAILILFAGAACLVACPNNNPSAGGSGSEKQQIKIDTPASAPASAPASVPAASRPAASAPRQTVWLTDFDKALVQAESEGKYLVVDFFATWCGPCKVMEQTTLADNRVRRKLDDFVPVKIDVDQHTDLASRYGIRSIPTTAVLEADGQPLASAVGYLDTDSFLEFLSEAGKLPDA